MSRKLLIEIEGLEVIVELNETKTAQQILDKTPFTAEGESWGEEFYFSTPAQLEDENLVSHVKRGDVGFWPPENSLCLFFGPTPITKDPGKIIPDSPVLIIGKILSPVKITELPLKAKVRVSRYSQDK